MDKAAAVEEPSDALLCYELWLGSQPLMDTILNSDSWYTTNADLRQHRLHCLSMRGKPKYTGIHSLLARPCCLRSYILEITTVCLSAFHCQTGKMLQYFLPALAVAPALAWTHSLGVHYGGTHERFGHVPGNDFGIHKNATYDYIVVGGGTAGLAVAYRLAEDGTRSVAVVEAGAVFESPRATGMRSHDNGPIH